MFNVKNNVLEVTLPKGKTQEELIFLCEKVINEIEKSLYGLNVFINGRITSGMTLFLGHRLAHITKNVSIFDPKENKYFLCV